MVFVMAGVFDDMRNANWGQCGCESEVLDDVVVAFMESFCTTLDYDSEASIA